MLRYWVWEPVLSAPPDYELRSPIIEHNKAVQSTFLRTEITLAFCRKRSLEGSFFKNTGLSFSCGRTKYGGFLIRWCHASYNACPIRIRCAWAPTFSKPEKPPFSISKIEYPDTCERTLRSWRYCVGARLKFFAARDGPAVKSHSTILQRLRRQISLDFITTAPTPNLTRLLPNTASYTG